MVTFKKILCAVAAVTLTTPAIAADNPKVTTEIMAMARAQWAAEINGKSVSEQTSVMADDYTEFNGDHPTRIDGKDMNMRFYQAWSDGPKSIAGDMMNPKVQTYGDTAILTYNYVGLTKAKDGEITTSNAKSTRVYHRSNNRWMLVHANFAPITSGD